MHSLTCCLCQYAIRFAGYELYLAHQLLLDIRASDAWRFVVWVLYSIVVTLLAQFVTHWLSPIMSNKQKRSAATGGIPELKTILSGSKLSTWLSLRM